RAADHWNDALYPQ
ncbi:hypothetical protein EC960939_3067, partial [Escherichia coli 96.0939]